MEYFQTSNTHYTTSALRRVLLRFKTESIPLLSFLNVLKEYLLQSTPYIMIIRVLNVFYYAPQIIRYTASKSFMLTLDANAIAC